MDIRKRRRLLKPSLSSIPSGGSLLSPRTLFLCIFCFVAVVFLSRGFHPARIVPTLSLLSSSASNSIRGRLRTTSRSLVPELRIQLPDSLLLFLHKPRLPRALDCVYRHAAGKLAFHRSLSSLDYDEHRWLVRCPLPPANYSSAVTLDWHVRRRNSRSPAKNTREAPRWNWAAYEAAVDGDVAVVFVKGFNLRPDKEYDPRQFRCRFQPVKAKATNTITTTVAISAGQEVVRCPLPDTIKEVINRQGEAVKISVERPRVRQLLPSVARLYPNSGNTSVNNNKYKLCGCNMVWNQAAALREWVVYHAWLGVERWFIYDNNSDDALGDEIRSLNSQNYNVTRHAWPWIKAQEAGFSQCVLRAKRECEWVAFFDVDEFFYFPPSKPHHRANNDTASHISSNGTSDGNDSSVAGNGYGGEGALRAMVNDSPSGVGEIRTKCHSFGPSGLDARPPKGVTVGYTCRLQRPERHKSIVRPEAVDDTLLNAVHHFRLRQGFVFQNTAEGRAVINHYKYQVWDVFKAKFSRRVSTYVADWQDNQNEGSRDRAPGLGKEAVQPLDWRRWYCQVWDTGLRDFVVANFADTETGLLPWEASVSL